MALLTACDSKDESGVGSFDSNTQIVLTFVTSNDGTSTRSAAEDPDGYEAGVGYENYIDFDNGNYKIYFFTYSDGDAKGGTLIAKFKPDEISTDGSGSTYTTYTITGNAPTALIGESNFRVVMLANWGVWYPSVTVGTTTIADLCEGDYTTYNAKTTADFELSATNLIPFYGVQEYSNTPITAGTTIKLSTPVSLLRAMAKVEVIVESAVNQDLSFDDVSIINYNSQGYCAPWQVYKAKDYNADYSIQPEDDKWSSVFVDGLHLVVGANYLVSKSISFLKTQELETATDGSITQYETWTCYLTEYDNSGSDYSYIQVLWGGVPYYIYFANYSGGKSSTPADYDINRNNLYRFYVTYNGGLLRIRVEEWGDVFDNEETFGETDPQAVGYTFSVNGINYEVLTSTVAADGVPLPDVSLEDLAVGTIGGTFGSEVVIPETIVYHGFTYKVTEIGARTFDGEYDITSITLPETIKLIGTYAFRYCTSLTSLTVLSYTPPECGEYIFYGVNGVDDTSNDPSNITLYVHDAVKQTYEEDATWGSFGFKEIIGI